MKPLAIRHCLGIVLAMSIAPAQADNNPFSGATSIRLTMHRVHRPNADKPWPKSQCANGWVDAMTGMCYRGKR